MKIFHCDHCDQLVFFENTVCVNCERRLAYLSDIEQIGSLDRDDAERWISPLEGATRDGYRLCANYEAHDVCNWALPVNDPHPLCPSCRLSRMIPDLSVPGHHVAWYKLEVAKRRLVYTLLQL